MILKLNCSNDGTIKSATIYENGEKIRDAEINKDFVDLINSVEINLDKYAAIKAMSSKNDSLKKLVESMDLTLLL